MHIILEGNECCFKTTIANKLSEKLKYNIVKGSSFELTHTDTQTYFEHIIKIALSNNLIVDRFVYSNLTYTEMLGFPSQFARLDNFQLYTVEQALRNKNALVVYLHTDVDTIIERIGKRGEDAIKLNQLQIINDLFEDYISESEIDVLSLNTADFTSDEIVEIIMEDVVRRIGNEN